MAKDRRSHIQYSLSIAAEICRRIAQGESVTSICGPKRRAGLPLRRSVHRWVAQHPGFERAYVLAKELEYAPKLAPVYLPEDWMEDAWAETPAARRARIRVERRRWREVILGSETAPEALRAEVRRRYEWY